MNAQKGKKEQHIDPSSNRAINHVQGGENPTFQFKEEGAKAVAQRKMQGLANNSSQVKKSLQLQAKADNLAAPQSPVVQKQENRTGLPDHLKAGIESLSGYTMDDVKVHYNSDKPAQLNAHAYAQGTDIHVAPGQEKHLPHEAWHVVQQKQGRVRPTLQMKGGVNVNEDVGLENEADVKGGQAMAHQGDQTYRSLSSSPVNQPVHQLYGAIRFANLNDENQEFKTKAEQLITVLKNTGTIRQFLSDKNVLITLELDSGNLASVSVDGDQVQVTLSPWYFKNESLGRNVALLVHEFGIHPLADSRMSQQELDDENSKVYKEKSEDNEEQSATELFTGFQGHRVRSNKSNQDDHLFGTIEGNPRFVHYRHTLFDAAVAMLGHLKYDQVTKGQIREAIMAYLADMATILATNDNRLGTLSKYKEAAEFFNHLRERWIAWLSSLHDHPAQVELIELTPPPQIGKDVLNQSASLAKSFFKRPLTDVKDNEKLERKSGVAMGLSDAQRGVLADYGLHIVPVGGKKGYPTLFDAIDQVMGKAGHSTQALGALANTKPADSTQAKNKKALETEYGHIQKGTQKKPLSYMLLNNLEMFGIKGINILKPNGKFDRHAGGKKGPIIIIVEITEPTYHYLVAK